MVVRGSACEAASCTSRSGTPASSAAVMNACLSVCGPHWPGDPSAAGGPADDPGCAVPVQPATVSGQEYRSFAALPDGQVDRPRGTRCERDGDDLAALAGDHQYPVAALDARSLDAGASGFGDPQPIEGQQRDQRVLGRVAQAGGDQERAEFVAVQRSGV